LAEQIASRTLRLKVGPPIMAWQLPASLSFAFPARASVHWQLPGNPLFGA
jgi:hypothetical protein